MRQTIGLLHWSVIFSQAVFTMFHCYHFVVDSDEFLSLFKDIYLKSSNVLCIFLKTNQGIKNLNRHEADRLAGVDPDYALRDLYDSIATGNFPSWTMYIQVMTFAEAERFKWNPFDITKVCDNLEHSMILTI